LFICTPVMDLLQGQLVPVMQDARRDSAHLGVYLLLAQLERADRPCDVLDWVAEHPAMGFEDVAAAAAQYKLVLFSCNSMNWATVRLLALRIRDLHQTVRLAIGGPHPTLYPEATARTGLFDACFRGEADRSIHQIYDALLEQRLPAAAIPGLWLARTGGPMPAVFQDAALHELNRRPAYHRIAKGQFLAIPVETSRGCNYRCAFCSIPSKTNWRGYPLKQALEQLWHAHAFLDATAYRKVSIIDDTFTRDRERIKQLCAALPVAEFGGRLMYDATLVDLRDRELVAALAPFTSDLLIGAEVSSISDARRITKPASPQLQREVARSLADAGLAERAVFSFTMGFPWQTVDDCLRTVAFITELISDYGIRVYLQWYWPMPGSEIWRNLELQGRVDLSVADTPGFYRSKKWFFDVRRITPEEFEVVHQRIGPVQLCLALAQGPDLGSKRPFEYSPLRFEDADPGWETRRNPFLGPAHDAPGRAGTMPTS
jgi:radical SAM superfamily enzyme YgiQ (UPF0313 family)